MMGRLAAVTAILGTSARLNVQQLAELNFIRIKDRSMEQLSPEQKIHKW
jgi:hypothetical protein